MMNDNLKVEPNFFKVNRALLYSPRWLSEPFTRGQAWVDLFGLAQHTDGFFRVRGIKIDVKRGQLAYSQLTLGARWKWSRGKVRRYLKELENNGDIVQQNNEVTTLITIVKYNIWQGDNTTNGQQTVQQTDNKRYTYKNDKNDKNEKNKESHFVPPTLEAVFNYCKERDNGVNPANFIDHYQANGWFRGKTKIKDWKACVRTWEKDKPRRRKEQML